MQRRGPRRGGGGTEPREGEVSCVCLPACARELALGRASEAAARARATRSGPRSRARCPPRRLRRDGHVSPVGKHPDSFLCSHTEGALGFLWASFPCLLCGRPPAPSRERGPHTRAEAAGLGPPPCAVSAWADSGASCRPRQDLGCWQHHGEGGGSDALPGAQPVSLPPCPAAQEGPGTSRPWDRGVRAAARGAAVGRRRSLARSAPLCLLE